jgi:hypothetical protein
MHRQLFLLQHTCSPWIWPLARKCVLFIKKNYRKTALTSVRLTFNIELIQLNIALVVRANQLLIRCGFNFDAMLLANIFQRFRSYSKKILNFISFEASWCWIKTRLAVFCMHVITRVSSRSFSLLIMHELWLTTILTIDLNHRTPYIWAWFSAIILFSPWYDAHRFFLRTD